jgi:hypothetical protein
MVLQQDMVGTCYHGDTAGHGSDLLSRCHGSAWFGLVILMLQEDMVQTCYLGVAAGHGSDLLLWCHDWTCGHGVTARHGTTCYPGVTVGPEHDLRYWCHNRTWLGLAIMVSSGTLLGLEIMVSQ